MLICSYGFRPEGKSVFQLFRIRPWKEGMSSFGKEENG